MKLRNKLAKSMKMPFVVVAISVISAGASAQAPPLEKMDLVDRLVPDGPVAFVDGSPISREDFLFLYHSQLMMAAMQVGEKNVDDEIRVRTGARCLGELVRREILWQEAKRRNITVSEADINEEYANRLKTLQEQLKEPDKEIPTEAEILTRSGMTKAETQENVRKALMVQRAADAILKSKKVVVSDAEVNKIYQEQPELFQRPNQIHLKQIFIRAKSPVNEKSQAAAEETAKKALARIRTGESFEAIAKALSNAPDAVNGGDLGPIPPEQLPPFYVDEAKTMKPGDISEPIRSEHGFHIIKLVAAENASTIPLEEVRDQVKEVLLEDKHETAINEFCSPIMNDAKRVRLFLSLEKELAQFVGDVNEEDAALAPSSNTGKSKKQ
ncbi:MAG TPA: peptidylprolyl isomerase [Candidatus Hydrogenedentes bacterium]|nr:peptidylprolyl isomerase [Candidatus Hydrogenedentota bacterium]